MPRDDGRSFWATFPGILTAIAALITATGGLIGVLYAGGIIGGGPPTSPTSTASVTGQTSSSTPTPSASSSSTSPSPLRQMSVEVIGNPPHVQAGGSTIIRVEVLSNPDSPIADANVHLHVGGGFFTQTNGLDVTGATNEFGFFAANWQSPATAPAGQNYGYLFAISVTKTGYEGVSKRITITID